MQVHALVSLKLEQFYNGRVDHFLSLYALIGLIIRRFLAIGKPQSGWSLLLKMTKLLDELEVIFVEKRPYKSHRNPMAI